MSLSRVLDWRNAALMSTEANLKSLLAVMAIRGLKDSLETVGLSDWGFRVSWNPQATSLAFVF